MPDSRKIGIAGKLYHYIGIKGIGNMATYNAIFWRKDIKGIILREKTNQWGVRYTFLQILKMEN